MHAKTSATPSSRLLSRWISNTTSSRCTSRSGTGNTNRCRAYVHREQTGKKRNFRFAVQGQSRAPSVVQLLVAALRGAYDLRQLLLSQRQRYERGDQTHRAPYTQLHAQLYVQRLYSGARPERLLHEYLQAAVVRYYPSTLDGSRDSLSPAGIRWQEQLDMDLVDFLTATDHIPRPDGELRNQGQRIGLDRAASVEKPAAGTRQA